MSEDTGIQAAVDAGALSVNAAQRVVKVWDEIPVAVIPRDMKVEVLEGALELSHSLGERPPRLDEVTQHHEVESFIAHVNHFKTDNTALWVDTRGPRIEACYDYHHGPGEPGWCRHRAVYACPLDEAWHRWTAITEGPMSQEELADFLDSNYEDLTSPPEDMVGPKPMDLLEMARDLQIHTKGQFSRKIDPATGEYAMVCKEEHTQQSTKIPRQFWIGIPVFCGGAAYRIEFRLRFKLSEGKPKFYISMHRGDAVMTDALNEVRARIAKETGVVMYAGRRVV